MGFFDKFRAAVSRFMSGRYGSDQLNLTMVIGALIVTTIGSLSGVYFLTLAADALLLLAIFRMFSKDRYRRAHENQVYLEKTQKVRRAATEWVNRVKNSRKYHYYTCPKCKQRLRVPRGVGKIELTCPKCGRKKVIKT